MEMMTFDVVGRVKRNPIAVASTNDFSLLPSSHRRSLEWLFAEKAVSPYCLDVASGRIWLVETCADLDLSAETFVYEAQYTGAQRIHSIGIGDFISACRIIDLPSKVLLIHSTGRCGSTLLANDVRNAFPGGLYSEPDIFTQLATVGRAQSERACQAFIRLHESCIRFYGRHSTDMLAFKFRSVVCEHADYLGAGLPSGTNCFLYRPAHEVARSYARVTMRHLPSWILSETERNAWSKLVPLLRTLSYPITGYDLMAAMWAGPVLRYLETHSEPIWRGAFTYADLVEHRTTILTTLLSDIGLVGGLTQPFGTAEVHSQAGTHLAPNRRPTNAALEQHLDSSEFEEQIAESLLKIDARLYSAMVLPGTFACH